MGISSKTRSAYICIPERNVVMLLVAKFSLFDEEYIEISRHNTYLMRFQPFYNSSEVLSIYRFRPNLRLLHLVNI